MSDAQYSHAFISIKVEELMHFDDILVQDGALTHACVAVQTCPDIDLLFSVRIKVGKHAHSFLVSFR